MKKFLLLCACLIGMYTNAVACDVCGCSSGASYLGTLPQLNRSFIGLRYGFACNRVHSIPSLSGTTPAPVTEFIHTTEVWGRFFPVKRVQLMASVPFGYYTKGGAANLGLGDATLMAGYILYNNGDSIGAKIKQTVILNGGLKLPTGAYTKATNGERLQPGMQPGTGSVDFVANAFYSLRYRKAGFAADALYKINTSNRAGYRSGNRFMAAAKAFVWLRANRVSILPSIGAAYENTAHDGNNNVRVNYSGGQAVFGQIGFDCYYRKMGAMATVQLPVAYSYNGNLTQPIARVNLQLFYTF